MIAELPKPMNSHSTASAVPPPVRRLESVQILRGVAAMLVVIHHAGFLLVTTPTSPEGQSLLLPSRYFAQLTATGVDLFFVISGFVMALSARRFVGPAGAGVFLTQRFIRIAPLFYLATLVMLAESLRAHLPIDPVSVLNSITFIPFFDDDLYSWPLHYLGWTLAFEFVFYLFVAALIAAGVGGRNVLLLAVVAALPLLGMLLQPQLILWKTFTNGLIWEFALGVLACILWQKHLLERLRPAFAAGFVLSLIAAAVALRLFPDDLLKLGFEPVAGANMAARSFYWGVPAFFFFCTVVGSPALAEGRLARLLRLLGDASYSIYLSHLFVVMLVRAVYNRVSLPPDVIVLATVVLSAVVGIAVYRLAEQPMLALGQRSIRGWSLRHMRTAG
jgi:exopolysaccharide production protein ExoZ